MTRHAPSRAARLTTIDRLSLAEHAATLLESKEEALARERSRLAGHVGRSGAEWIRLCTLATHELLRARAMGASGEIARLIHQDQGRATVSANWTDSMGITYPGETSCHPKAPTGMTGTAALAPTWRAHCAAMEAGAVHAATTAALDRLDGELSSTRRRRRAIADHLVPTITAELHSLELQLDEQDREEAVRIQLVMDRRHTAELRTEVAR